MSVVSHAASVDWTVVAGAIGTFIAAIYATIKGFQKGKEKVESGRSAMTTSVVGGTIMDNISMKDLTLALKDNTDAVRDHTRQLERHNDIVVMIGRKE